MALSEDAAAIVASNLTAAIVTATKKIEPLYHPGGTGFHGSRKLVENIYVLMLERVRNGEVSFHPDPPTPK